MPRTITIQNKIGTTICWNRDSLMSNQDKPFYQKHIAQSFTPQCGVIAPGNDLRKSDVKGETKNNISVPLGVYQRLNILILGFLLLLFASTATAQTFETSADAYYELQPQFIEDGEYLKIYFNLKFEDTEDDIYDLVHRVEIRWNGTIIYTVEHTGLSFEDYGSNYTVSTFDASRFGPDTFRSYTLTSVAASMTVSRSNTAAYSGAEDVVQQLVSIKKADMHLLESVVTTSTFTIDGFYHDQGSSGNSTDDVGHHISNNYTVTPEEEDTDYGNELEFTSGRSNGYNRIIWNVAKFDGETFYDHLACMDLYYHNGDFVWKKIFNIRHSSGLFDDCTTLGNSDASGSFNIPEGDGFTFSTTAETTLLSGSSYKDGTDDRIEVYHYYRPEDYGKTLYYSLEGDYYVRDFGGNSGVSVGTDNQTQEETAFSGFEIPDISINTIGREGSTSNITLAYTAPADFGESITNRIYVYRDGSLIADLDAQNGAENTSFTDINTQNGVSHSYEIALAAQRVKNGAVISNLSGPKTLGVTTDSQGNSFELTSAYHELQPQFIEEDDYINFYFNLEIWDEHESPYATSYDHLGEMNIKWDDQIIYAISHNGVINLNLGVDFETHKPTTTRWEDPNAYTAYVHHTIVEDIEVTYSNITAYGDTEEATQVRVKVPKAAVGNIQAANATVGKFQFEGTSYRDRFNGVELNEYAGTHYSKEYTFYTKEENSSGNDETDFSATFFPDDGYVEVKFRAEKHFDEQHYDHLECISIEVDNLTKGGSTRLARVGHNSLTCDHDDTWDSIVQSGDYGDAYQVSWYDSNKIDIGHSYDGNGDHIYSVKHYFDDDVLADDLRYYILGTYYARDQHNVRKSVEVTWQANQSTITPSSAFTMPMVTGFAVSPSTTDCEIDLSWNAYTPFGDFSDNLIVVFRDGVDIGSFDPQVQTTFTDTNIEAGTTYSYRVASAYDRAYNESFIGQLTAAENGQITLLEAPAGIGTTQASCDGSLTVSWIWASESPDNFIIQRKEAETGFADLVTNLSGALRDYTDTGILEGIQYSYRVAAKGGACSAIGSYSPSKTHSRDTIDLAPTIALNALKTSKGYYTDRTELFWELTGFNEAYVNRFRVYARELGTQVVPTLVESLERDDRSWFHERGDGNVIYEYFVTTERVIETECGFETTKSFDIEAVDGLYDLPMQLPDSGVAYAIGLRSPAAVVNGNITYSGGIAVPNVKVIIEPENQSPSKSLDFNGAAYVLISNDASIQLDTAMTLSAWLKPEDLSKFAVVIEKQYSYGLHLATDGSGYFYIKNAADGTEHKTQIAASKIEIGQWINLMCTYAQSTRALKLYINGVLESSTILDVSVTGIQKSTQPLSFGRQHLTENHYYQGKIDETRIYNRALSATDVQREYGRITSTNAAGLVAYWKVYEGAGNNIFDAARLGSFFYRNDGELFGVDWSNDIPTQTQLGIAGFTNAFGNYSIEGIPYTGNGENFRVSPTVTLSGVVHEFNPGSNSIFLGEGNSVENGINFEDISAFELSGQIVYDFEDEVGSGIKSVGSAGVQIYLNGVTPLVDGNGNPIVTDNDGIFDIMIPIGHHYLTFEKEAHTFTGRGRFPHSGYFNFQKDVSGLIILDQTTHKFVGTVAGGTKSENAAIFGGEQVNNIGQTYFELVSEDLTIRRTVETDINSGVFSVDLPPLEYNFSDIKWRSDDIVVVASGDIQQLKLGSEEAYNGMMELDSADVPVLVQIYPELAARQAIDHIKIDSINGTTIHYSWNLNNSNLEAVSHQWIGSADTISYFADTDGSGFDAGAYSHQVDYVGDDAIVSDSSLPKALLLVFTNGQGESFEVGVELGFVTSNPLAEYDTTGYEMVYDTSYYHVREDFSYRVVPTLEVSTVGDTLFWGESIYSYNGGEVITDIDLNQLPYPTFFSNEFYDLQLSASEIYINKDNERAYQVAVTDGSITVNSSIGIPYTVDENGEKDFGSGSQLSLDEDGIALYKFTGGNPSLTQVSSTGEEQNSFTYTINAVLQAGGYAVSWPEDPANDPQRAYVMGRVKVPGASFITEAPETVEFILRDPPGSNSYAFREAGTSYSASEEFVAAGFGGLGGRQGGGVGLGFNFGGSFVGHGELGGDIDATVSVGVRTELEASAGSTVERSVELTETISTNADPIEVGRSDVYVAKSQNLETGIALKVLPLPLSACGSNCFGDIITMLDGSQYQMGLVQESYVSADGLPTYAIYSQGHIETVLIPDLEDLRNALLVNAPDYISNLTPIEELYGTNNDNPLWGIAVSSADAISSEVADLTGPSYSFNNGGDNGRQDSVRYYNQQIRLWEEVLAFNEIEKWAALQSAGLENVSLASGITLERSTTNTASAISLLSFETSTAIEVNINIAVDAIVAIRQGLDAEVGLKTNTTSTRGEETANTIGYVLLDPDENDALSIDVAPGVGSNGPVFSVVAGQTMCPHEPALYMKYATSEYIDRAILERGKAVVELAKSKNLTDIIAAQVLEQIAKAEGDVAKIEDDLKDYAKTIEGLVKVAVDADGIQKDIEKLLLGIVGGAPGLLQTAIEPVLLGVNEFIGAIQDISIPIPFAGNISPFDSIEKIPLPDNPSGVLGVDLGVIEEITARRMRAVGGVAKGAIDAGNELIVRLQKRLKDRLFDINILTQRKLELDLDIDKINAEIDAMNNQIVLFDQLQTVLTTNEGPIQLSNATLQREKPTLQINGAQTAQVFNVPADENANFTLLLGNESESGDAQYYSVAVLDHTNPNGLILKIDGTAVNSTQPFLVPGNGAISKVLTVERGPFDYDYTDVELVIHSTCQYDPTGNDALVVDGVSFNASFLPTCTDVEIVSPTDSWTANNSLNNKLPIVISGYDINSNGFERIKIQSKPSNSSDWTLLETYYRDESIEGWNAEPTLPQSGNVFNYDWDFEPLSNGNYDIRAVATCVLAETKSNIHSGIIDKINPHPFGNPLPADGILSPEDEIMIQFNEPINAGLLSPSNFDIRGVLNGGDLRHDAAVNFNGITDKMTIPSGINLTRKPFSFDMYFKRDANGEGVLVSQGATTGTALEIGFNAANQIAFTLAGETMNSTTAITDTDWHHLAITYNVNTNDAIIYLDGGDDAINNSFNTDYTAKGEITIGSGFGTGNFSGYIHELRIWNKELSTSEVNIAATKRLSRTTPSLIANWEMEEAFGNTAFEKVKLLHATVSGNRQVFPIGNSLAFTGASYIETNSPALTVEQSFTVSFWMKSTDTNTTLLSNGKGIAPDANINGWSFNINGSGQMEVNNNEITFLLSNDVVNDGNWHHVALSSNKLSNTTGVIDGKEGNSTTSKQFGGFAGSNLWIGARVWFEGSVQSNDRSFTGNLDEIRIWNTNRSIDQIAIDQYNKLSGDEGALLVYYPMEKLVGLTNQNSLANQIEVVNADDLVLAGGITFSAMSPNVKQPRPVEKVNFSYSSNGDRIVLTPRDDASKIENATLEITVRNIQDLNGNVLQNPVTWTAYVDRNQVVWLDEQIVLEKALGEVLTFSSKVVNMGGAVYSYDIRNLPSWLSASPASGTIEPLTSEPITFTIAKGLNIGKYTEDIYLSTEFGFDERLELDLKVFQPAPADWIVNPADFQFSMSVIGQLEIGGVLSREEDDMIAAFVNNEIRGVATLNHESGFDNYQAFLSIYSNVTSGETIEFRVWNSREGRVHTNITPVYDFESDARRGSPSAPIVFAVPDFVRREVELSQGWQWLSFNLESAEMTNVNNFLSEHRFVEGDIIKSQYDFDQYDPTIGWFGSLTANGGLQLNQMYKLQTNNTGIVTFEGNIANPSTSTIDITVGWNWIGFISQRNMNVNAALAGYAAQAGDEIKGQRDFAVYTGVANGWVGSLEVLVPGQGYLLNASADASFVYPEESTVNGRNANSSPDYSYFDLVKYQIDPARFRDNMSFIAQIPNATDNEKLLVFVNDEVRGIAIPKYNPVLDAQTYFTVVYGYGQGEELTFKSLASNEVFDLTAEINMDFVVNAQLGTVQNPILLNKPFIITGLENQKGTLEIYPNPFTTEVSLSGRLIDSKEAKVEVISISGQLIQKQDIEVVSGAFDFSWNGKNEHRTEMRPGIYLLKITTDKEVSTFRIIKK